MNCLRARKFRETLSWWLARIKRTAKKGDIRDLFTGDHFMGFDEEINRSEEPKSRTDAEQADVLDTHRAGMA